jgi:hypothetical protein
MLFKESDTEVVRAIQRDTGTYPWVGLGVTTLCQTGESVTIRYASVEVYTQLIHDI